MEKITLTTPEEVNKILQRINSLKMHYSIWLQETNELMKTL